MRCIIQIALIVFATFCLQAQTVENGVVKEYHGKKSKTNLSGVELMVKGAPSTVSDANGHFTLRFSTLKPGDKVDYSEIYKDGYVIFNKDALDAWRISNNGSTFTVIMCKETDFRALKKKFYGIIEKSYKAEFEKQKAIAEKSISDALKLKLKINELKKKYDEKLSNINTYVELFSRIDRSEMDSIEAKSLHYIELGEIDKAIEAYEEMQLNRQVQGQMRKWDSGIAMVEAGNNMIEQGKSDLMVLVDKMHKQIGLYEMGGTEYSDKRKAMIGDIIPILYRLNAATSGHYNELLGQMIIERSKYHKWNDQLADYREAAAIPSIVGLSLLGRRWEMLAIHNHEYSDSARAEYEKILVDCQPNDSTRREVLQRLAFIPKAVYKDDDGNEYPFGFWGKNNSEIYLCGRSSFVSTHLEGDVKLPDEISYNGRSFPVTAISNFAFGNNSSLRKVTLPKHLRSVANGAFGACAMLDTIVAPPTLNRLSYQFYNETVITFPEGIDDLDFLSSLYNELANSHTDPKKYAGAKQELLKTHARASAKQKEHEISRTSFQILIANLLANGDTISALAYAKENVKLNGADGELMLGTIHQLLRDYDQAFKHLKKALKTGAPDAYNQMAYVYAYPEFGRQDFKKAHEYIAVAIEKCQNDSIRLPIFLDTKGELVLMEGKVDDARRLYNDIIAFSPDFYVGQNSVLYKQFCPQGNDTSTDDNQEGKPDSDPYNLQNYIDIVQLVAHNEYNLAIMENFLPVDYEELLSIGIIAVQVLIKDKTPKQLKQYNTLYIATAISWAIRNELQIRYPWYNGINGIDSYYETNMPEEFEKLNVDIKQLSVIYAIYLNIKDLYNTALELGLADTLAFKEIERYRDLIIKAKETMNEGQKEFIDFYLSRNSDVAEIEKRFDPTTIIGSFNIIRNTFNENNEFGYGIDTGTTTNRNKHLQSYLDIVKLVADNEMRYVKSFGMNLDYEELLSIGIIAVQVMIKNKTPEELSKFNTAYISAAITWAIRNELRIRYKNYSQASQVLDFHANDNAQGVRMAVYHIVKDLYYQTGVQTDSKAMQEIKELMECIDNAKSHLTGAELKCAEYFFDKNSVPKEINERYSTAQIVGMLDAIKKNSKDKSKLY